MLMKMLSVHFLSPHGMFLKITLITEGADWSHAVAPMLIGYETASMEKLTFEPKIHSRKSKNLHWQDGFDL